ncbi:hypothetical protein DH2020_003757 [Rehmannia glutinosa]|uniref:Remorin C-terminal domain-containing protein n=1 Tax=Rehmannia glutinosa TaxID=99300 RepID=A0ABR0XMK8_REHGL
MRPIEDKGCLNNGNITQEISGGSCMSFEFHKNNVLTRSASHHRTALGKPTPSKWDNAQKWLVNLSRGEKNQSKASPRNSNADDRRLIAPVPKKEYSSSEEEGGNGSPGSNGVDQFDEETKNVDCDESVWRINKPVSSSKSVVRSICVRDMGTEMTPIASQEPSRTATPIRATTPAARSPICWDRRPRLGTNEEVKIQAWENHQKRKAEMEKRKVEVKAERLKSRAQEKYTNKLAATRRIAEEKRANAEAKLNEKAVKTSQRADYIRRTGHLPSSFSFKLPSFCW